LANTTVNAGRVLEAIGRSDIPVYPGARKPFCRLAVHAVDIHGTDTGSYLPTLPNSVDLAKLLSVPGTSGLDGTDLLPAATKPAVTEPGAVVAMRDALLSQPSSVPWVVATGTLTNVALLFATFPEVADHIGGLSIMGGGIGEGFSGAPISKVPGEEARIGNVTPWAEFNIYVRSTSSLPILCELWFIRMLIQLLVLLTEPASSAIQNPHNPLSRHPFWLPKQLSLLWI